MNFEDFNNLPDHITQEIFKCLTFEDLCNVSLVCKTWNDYIKNNPNCMSKIRLRIEGWQDLEIVTKVLLQNGRNYTAIVLQNLNPQKPFEYLDTGRCWKEVLIKQMKFPSTTDFRDYLNRFGGLLEVLEIEKVIISCEENLTRKLEFSRIKKLKLIQVPTAGFPVFTRYPTLRTLHFDIPAFGTQSRSLIINFFENFLNGNIEELSIRRNSLYGLSLENVTSIESIITSMSTTLKKLSLLDWGKCHTIERLWNELRVEHFSINFCSQQPQIQDLSGLYPNHCLKSLELHVSDIPNVQWCLQLFKLAPQLEELFITKIRKEIVYHAAQHLQCLKVFKYVSCAIDISTLELNLPLNGTIVDVRTNEDPGKEYEFLGTNESFNLDGNGSGNGSLSFERYIDENLFKSFASVFYQKISNVPGMNKNIKIVKN